MVIAPGSRIGPVNLDERNGLISHSPLVGKYDEEVDRESAYEKLHQGVKGASEQANASQAKGN